MSHLTTIDVTFREGIPSTYTLILKKCNACNPQTSIIPAYPDAEFPMVSCRIDLVCQCYLVNNHSSCQKRNIKFSIMAAQNMLWLIEMIANRLLKSFKIFPSSPKKDVTLKLRTSPLITK
jgi:hypothetical protein